MPIRKAEAAGVQQKAPDVPEMETPVEPEKKASKSKPSAGGKKGGKAKPEEKSGKKAQKAQKKAKKGGRAPTEQFYKPVLLPKSPTMTLLQIASNKLAAATTEVKEGKKVELPQEPTITSKDFIQKNVKPTEETPSGLYKGFLEAPKKGMVMSYSTEAYEYLAWFIENDVLPALAQGMSSSAWYSSRRLRNPDKIELVVRGNQKVVKNSPRVAAGGIMAKRVTKAGNIVYPKKANVFAFADWVGKNEMNVYDSASGCFNGHYTDKDFTDFALKFAPSIAGSDLLAVWTGRNASERQTKEIIKTEEGTEEAKVTHTVGFLGDFSLWSPGQFEDAINMLVPSVVVKRKGKDETIPLTISLGGGVTGNIMGVIKDAKGNVITQLEVERTVKGGGKRKAMAPVTVQDELAYLKEKWLETMDVQKDFAPKNKKAYDAAKKAYEDYRLQIGMRKLASSANHMAQKVVVDVIVSIAKECSKLMVEIGAQERIRVNKEVMAQAISNVLKTTVPKEALAAQSKGKPSEAQMGELARPVMFLKK